MLLLTQNYLDTLVIGYVLLSALMGYMRGFYRELFRVIAWSAAFLITYLILPRFARALPLASVVTSYIVGGSILFFLLLAIFSLVFRLVYSLLDLARMLGFGDRLLGLSFGAVRGFFVFCLAYLLMSLVPAVSEPDVVRSARFRPFIVTGADFIHDVMRSFVSPRYMPDRRLRRSSNEGQEKRRVILTRSFDDNAVIVMRM